MLLPDRSTRRVLAKAACRAVGGLAAAVALSIAAHAVPPTPAADALTRLVDEKSAAEKPATEKAATPLPSLAAQDPANPPAVAEPAQPPGFAQKLRDSTSGMVVSAMNFLGVRYTRGGTSAEEGFDCSGFTRFVFENSIGLVLPRRADDQATAPGLVKVARSDLQPGDLVFFNTLRRTFSHVGIYVGENKFIHAPRTGGNVRVENMNIAYWAKRFTGARRAPGAEAMRPQPAVPVVSAKPAATPTPVTSSLMPTEGFWH